MNILEKRILKRNDAGESCLYASGHPKCDVKAHGKVVIDSGDSWRNYVFARDIKGADIKSHGQVVIDSRNAEYNYLFARDVKGADIKAHGQVVIDSRNAEYNYRFAKDIANADIVAHGEAVIDSRNAEYNYLFAKDIPNADIFTHKKVIEKYGTEQLLNEFDREIKGLQDYTKLNLKYDNEGNLKLKKGTTNPYNFSFKEVNNDELLSKYVQANVSVFLHGPSGVGKSARVKQLDPTATRITLRPQMNPEEVDGTLNRETGNYIPPLWYTQLCEKCEKEPDRKHILFIDELTNVKPTVQSLVYSIVLDRAGKDGLWPLPENAVVVAAGNESQGNLAAYPLTNALFRRFSHIYFEVNKEEWITWATKGNSSMQGKRIHPAIITYIMSKKDVLNQELDEENPHIVTDPRKWEMASKILYATNNPIMLLPAIGAELTADFVDFVQQMQLTPQDIVNGNYDKEHFKELNISQKLSTIAGLTIAQESELAKVREFIKDNLGKELLATYDTLWIGNDPERAMIIGELRENKNNEKSLNK